MGITLAHACLLTGVFFATSLHSHAYVSTEVHSLLFFRMFLTVIVLCEAILSATYIYIQGGSLARTASGEAFVAFAIAGWTLVASYPTETTEHLAGAFVFITCTALYSLYFIQRAISLKPWLYAMWTLNALLAIAFLVLYFIKLYDTAAILEWAAFTLDAITLFLFFTANPPSKFPTPKRLSREADFIMPLLDPLPQFACNA